MTLLIKGVRLLGSRRKSDELADVFVSGDKISAIGSFPNKRADEVIESQGCYLSPGFIDVHVESDHTLDLLRQPSQEDFLKQGVTTIVGGQGGASLAPLLYGTLESVRKWADLTPVNINWHTVDEFLSMLSRRPLGVNFATLVGHSTVRRSIVGEDLRALTKNEILVFARILNRALSEGGFGLSVDTNSVHAKQTSYREMKTLAEIVKKHNGIYAMYPRRSPSDLATGVAEAVKIIEETGVKTILNDFLPFRGHSAEYEKAFEVVSTLPERLECRFTLTPHEVSIAPLYSFLPEWAKNGNLETMNKNLKDEWLAKRIFEELPEVQPQDFFVMRAVRNDPLAGYSLKDIMNFYDLKSAKQALLKLMATTNLRALVCYRNIDGMLLRKSLQHPRSLVVSRGMSPGLSRLRAVPPAFPAFLSLVEEENLLPIEEAIRKITEEPARLFNFERRGVIEEGSIADLTGFRGGEVKFVVVNGSVAIRDGTFQGVLAGKVLKHSTQI